MIDSYEQAVNEIFARFNETWQAGATAIVGTIPEIRWQDRDEGAKPLQGVYWCRVSIQTVNEEQSTLSNCVVEPFKRRYYTEGLVFVQLFFPKSDDLASVRGRQLAELAKSAFRGKETPNKVVFSKARIVELSQENLFFRKNVVSEYEYGQIA